MRPNSSPNTAKMKSVWRSGRKSRWVWVPLSQPLPTTPPEPSAIDACVRVIARAERVARGIDEGQHALALVAVQVEPRERAGIFAQREERDDAGGAQRAQPR